MSKKFLVILSLFLITGISSDKITEIKIGDTQKGRMELDESHLYFSFKIRKEDVGKVLVVNTHQDEEILVKEDEIFSDPDFYISKIHKNPNSRKSSEWFSERYGTDILSITPDSFKEGDTFYLGMYCQYKCRYYLHIYMSEEVEIKLGDQYSVNLKPQSSINYKIFVKDPFEELRVVAYSETSGKFRIFMNKIGPSSQNTFNIIPSWIYGYSISVSNKNPSEYCYNCYYHILLQNEGSTGLNDIKFASYLPDKITEIDPVNSVYDAMNSHSKRCYKFKMTKKEKESEKLIIHTTMFSGNGFLNIQGWEPAIIADRLRTEKSEYSHKIVLQNYVILSKKDFDKFDNDKPSYKNKDSDLHFCFFSGPESSFVISAYYLTKMDKSIDDPNILIPGHLLRGYLLKDQVVKYEIVGSNLDKTIYNLETNITIVTKNVGGSLKTYGYFCQKDECKIDKNNIQNLITQKKLMTSYFTSFDSSNLDIPYKDNVCINPSIKNKNSNSTCSTQIILQCILPNLDNLCIYDIQLNIKDVPLLMIPKQVYHSNIPLGKEDNYEIKINDKKVHSIVVILNSESGDAELMFYRKEFDESKKTYTDKLIGLSFQNDYIPDVVRITPKKLGKENLIGSYIAKIKATTFASYHLYYYVTYEREEQQKLDLNALPQVTLNLELGQVISDYLPNDIRYKIYSFIPLVSKRQNFKVFFSRVNIDFSMFIFTDIRKFSILQFWDIKRYPGREIISGYDWKSDNNNEITILTTDPKYTLNKIYYIIIAPNKPQNPMENPFFPPHNHRNRDNHGPMQRPGNHENGPREHGGRHRNRDAVRILDPFNNTNTEEETLFNKKSAFKFYLGVASETVPLSISEGIPHQFILDNRYQSQMYSYIHPSIEKEFSIEINILYGSIDLFVDLKEIDLDEVSKIDDTTQLKETETSTLFFQTNINTQMELILSKTYFSKSKAKKEGVKLYFYIRKHKSVNKGEYIVVVTSNEDRGEILTPGQLKTSTITVGDNHHYLIEEVQKRKSSVINVSFKNCNGNVYVRIPQKPETKNIRFPTEGHYDYKGSLSYNCATITIPESEFNKLSVDNIKLQILITVVAESGYESDSQNSNKKNEMSYTISYSNEAKRINQNQPFDGFVSKGNYRFFTFYFTEETKNIYISLSNMNGDADMYLNYGEKLPTVSENDWRSIELNHEYISININDTYFKERKINSLSGYYTLLIVGFTDTTFTLFVSNHDKNVFPLRDNTPMTCSCKEKGEVCYFRYNNAYEKDNKEKGINHNEIIFTNQFLFGSGMLYGKLYKEQDLLIKDFYSLFPNENNFDMSNSKSQQKNYMKMKLEGSNYVKDSLVLLTFKCSESTQVDITPTSKRHFPSLDFIYENKDNIYYLDYDENKKKDEQPELTLSFYNFDKDKDLIYGIHSYTGKANFKVYSNDSHWDIKQQKIVYEYKFIEEFEINSFNYNQEENIQVYNPYSNEHHNSIGRDFKNKIDNILFKVTPKSEFGFYINCNFDKNWVNIDVGKSKSILVKNSEFYGYFDLVNEYVNIELNLGIERTLNYGAELYVKMNIIDRVDLNTNLNDKNKLMFKYSIPGENNFDYKVTTDKILNTISLNMKDLPKITHNIKESKFVRALVYVKLISINQETNGEKPKSDQNVLMTILVTPGEEKIKVKFVEAFPYNYYFSNITYNEKNQKDMKVYSITRESRKHDTLIIEISVCKGDYTAKIYSNIDDIYSNDKSKEIDYLTDYSNGKKTIIVSDLSFKHYYLIIQRSHLTAHCFGHNQFSPFCQDTLSYLMYYYTETKENVKLFEKTKELRRRPFGKGKMKIDIPLVESTDSYGNKISIKDYKFNIFLSTDEYYYEKMENICYLSRFVFEKDSIFTPENIKYLNATSIELSNLGWRKHYYVGVLGQNIQTKQLIAFKPIELRTGGFMPFPLFHIIGTYLIVGILGTLLVLYFCKYRKLKTELKEIKGDTLPKTESEMYDSRERTEIRYSGLGNSGY